MDKREFLGSFSVRIGTERVRFEIADAALFGGPAGTFRVRIGRCWHDGPDGRHLYLDRDGLADLVVQASLGSLPEPAAAPSIPRNARVSARIRENGNVRTTGGTVVAPPILAHDGRWMVPVMMYGGTRYVPVEDLNIHGGIRG